MTINVQKDNRNNVGYILLPKFYFSRPTDVKSVFGMIDEYLENTTITYQIKEFEKSNRLEIQNGEDIRKFLDPIVDGFIQQRIELSISSIKCFRYLKMGVLSPRKNSLRQWRLLMD